MIQRKQTLAAIMVLMLTITGCTHTQGPPTPDQEPSKRARNTLLTVGAALVVGAVLISKAKSNTKDAIRDFAPE